FTAVAILTLARGIDEAEDGGVGADAESKSEDRDGGEAGRFAQHAKGEAQILKERVQKGQAAAFAIDLAGLLDTAEVEKRLAPGLLRVHAFGEIALDRHLQMRTQLGIEVAIETRAAKQLEKAGGQHLNEFDHEVAFSTRLITAAISFQPVASSRSCLRRLRVSD